jgi:hypothetical protein
MIDDHRRKFPMDNAPAEVSISTRKSGFDCILIIRATTGQELMPKLTQTIHWLTENGFEPSASASTPAGVPAAAAAPSGSQVPTCPVHHCAMRPSKKPGVFFCPTKVSDDDGTGRAAYCKQTVKA